MGAPIYLDNNATTRTDPRVVEAMLPFFTEIYGNPASQNHDFGIEAGDAVQRAREQLAALINAQAKEIVFTSGATESNNLAIQGVARHYRRKGNHIVTCVIEHKAVLDPCKRMEREGFNITWLTPDETGRVSAEQVRQAITPQTILVTIMLANNEIGTLQPIREIAGVCRDHGVLLHCDAAQAVGKIPVDVQDLQVDLMSISGHKFYAPKGIGALYLRSRSPKVRIEPLCEGGGHERGIRPGTLAVPGIVGLGAAAEIARNELEKDLAHVRHLRDVLQLRILDNVEGVSVNGHLTERLPGTLNVSFDHVDGEALMIAMDRVACSSGSACTSASQEPSYVLRGIGCSDEKAQASLRFGVGRFNTLEEIEFAASEVKRVVEELRAMSPICGLDD